MKSEERFGAEVFQEFSGPPPRTPREAPPSPEQTPILTSPRATGGLWRDADKLVAENGAVCPDVCLKTGLPTDGPGVKRSFYWQHPLLCVLGFLNPPLYFLVWLFVRRSATIRFGVARSYRVRRRTTFLAMILGFASGVVAASALGADLFVWATLLFVGAVVIGGFLLSSPFTAVRIENGYVWISGVHPDFLAGLPDWADH